MFSCSNKILNSPFEYVRLCFGLLAFIRSSRRRRRVFASFSAAVVSLETYGETESVVVEKVDEEVYAKRPVHYDVGHRSQQVQVGQVVEA